MIIQCGYKTELRLNNKQRTLYMKHAGTSRFAWNWGLNRRIETYKKKGKSLNAIDLHKELNKLKKTDFGWMYGVSKCAPQEALRDLDKAFKNFFEGRAMYPRFKSKKNSVGSFRLTGIIKVFTNSIQLPRLGRMRLKEKNYLPTNAHILSATISEKAGRWFVSVQVEEDITVPINNGSVAGTDLGINIMAYVSDGTKFDNPRALRRYERKLKRAQRRLSKKEKGSSNRKKAVREVQSIHRRITNIRKDSIHKSTTYLAKNKSVIGLEDLNVSGMLKNHYLSKAISDAGIHEFRRQMEYKTMWYGSKIVYANRFFPSTKRCSKCGHINHDVPLSKRVFVCEQCGFTLDRDYNSSLNLEWVAVSSPDTHYKNKTPVGEDGSDLFSNEQVKPLSMNQESNIKPL